jgi:RNA polymerase sigma-70 factor, ECF subfamily
MNPMLQALDAAPRAEPIGDQLTIEEIYRQYREPLLRYLQRLCGSPEQAEELAQETFINAYTGLLAFRGQCSVATWLFRIARNLYLNSLRHPSSTRIDTDELLAIPDSRSYGDPVQQVVAGERRDRIGLALAQLPEQQRSVLLLRDAEGLAYIEIADVLGISLAAVKVTLFRARNAFRQAYRALEDEEGASDGEL